MCSEYSSNLKKERVLGKLKEYLLSRVFTQSWLVDLAWKSASNREELAQDRDSRVCHLRNKLRAPHNNRSQLVGIARTQYPVPQSVICAPRHAFSHRAVNEILPATVPTARSLSLVSHPRLVRNDGIAQQLAYTRQGLCICTYEDKNVLWGIALWLSWWQLRSNLSSF